MVDKQITIGISLGSRYIGYAVLRGQHTSLEEWHIHSFKEAWSPVKCKRITAFLMRIADWQQATHVAIKLPPMNKKAKMVKLLLKEVQKACVKRRIPVTLYSLDDLKATRPIRPKNKQEMMQYIADVFPCLQQYFARELRLRNQYHVKMFEAVFAAHMLHLQEAEQQSSLSMYFSIPSPYYT